MSEFINKVKTVNGQEYDIQDMRVDPLGSRVTAVEEEVKGKASAESVSVLDNIVLGRLYKTVDCAALADGEYVISTLEPSTSVHGDRITTISVVNGVPSYFNNGQGNVIEISSEAFREISVRSTPTPVLSGSVYIQGYTDTYIYAKREGSNLILKRALDIREDLKRYENANDAKIDDISGTLNDLATAISLAGAVKVEASPGTESLVLSRIRSALGGYKSGVWIYGTDYSKYVLFLYVFGARRHGSHDVYDLSGTLVQDNGVIYRVYASVDTEEEFLALDIKNCREVVNGGGTKLYKHVISNPDVENKAIVFINSNPLPYVTVARTANNYNYAELTYDGVNVSISKLLGMCYDGCSKSYYKDTYGRYLIFGFQGQWPVDNPVGARVTCVKVPNTGSSFPEITDVKICDIDAWEGFTDTVTEL